MKIEIELSKIELNYLFDAVDFTMGTDEKCGEHGEVLKGESIVFKLSRAERIAMNMPMATSP